MSEKEIKDFSLDESIDYILNSFKTTQYNQDAQNYFAIVMEHIRKGAKVTETINLPFTTEDRVTEIPLLKHEDGTRKISIQAKDGFQRIHEWDHYTREVLNNILIAIENKQRLGYFDSLIDLETNCNLINMARNIYINQFNKDGSRFKNQQQKITKEDIDKESRGGYSTEFKERMYRLLVNDNE